MTDIKTASYGSWRSPITSDLIVSETLGLSDIVLDGQDIYWLEMRPSEAGRSVIVRWTPGKDPSDITPADYNARTRVHEYGGASFSVDDRHVYFSNFSDQRLYVQSPEADPAPLSPDKALRFADGIHDSLRDRLICVCEDHTLASHEPQNKLISVDLQRNTEGRENQIETLAVGNDFYSSPCLSPDGSRLAWLSWNHPNMPWDGTELWMAQLNEDGSIKQAGRIAGGKAESIFQPQWSPDGTLYFVSDRTGWWNLYRWRRRGIEAVVPMQAEFGMPQWVFGMSTYAIETAQRLICAYNRKGSWQLAEINLSTDALSDIETPYTDIAYLRAAEGHAVFVGGSPTESKSIIRLDLKTRKFKVLRRSSRVDIDPAVITRPRAIEFPSDSGQTAHGFFYPPKNQYYKPPAGERAPLLVFSHGGPTAAATQSLNLMIQYWTSRGFAVLDVNYGGSTGYGRDYRRRLDGQWGIVDTRDCVNGAKYLVQIFDIDENRLAIRGGSAGGYTTLCALTFYDVFKAGASYYGVSDLEALAHETHKFESRYLDKLIGPYPEGRDVYIARSPIRHADRLSCPIIFLQGLEDKIVPPDQAEKMVQILRRKNLPVAYLTFEKEQHGFRMAQNIKRALDAELFFYSRIFGFELPDDIEPVTIENL